MLKSLFRPKHQLISSVCSFRSQLFTIMERSEKRPSTATSPNKITPTKRNKTEESPIAKLGLSTPTDRPFRVSVEGNIGAGKSTLIKYFEDKFPSDTVETHGEPIHWWRNLNGYNLLDLMYSNTQEWLKVFQSYVQLTRLKVQTSKPKNTKVTVQIFERSVQNNRFCFLEQAYKSGLLEGPDYEVLDQWYQWVIQNVNIDLDLIVYLRSTPEIVYERMKQRNRPEERQVSFEYLQQLHDSHEEWLMSENSPNTIPVLVLDADQTLEDITELYRLNQSKILGHEKRVPVTESINREKVRKALDLN